MLKSFVLPVVVLTLCAGFVVVGHRPASAATTYSIASLSELANIGLAYGSGADRSKVAGRTIVAPQNMRATIFTVGSVQNLGTISGFTHSQGHDVNDAGQTVGWVSNQLGGFNVTDRAFVHSGGTMTQLPVLPGANFTHAYSINNAGTIVGTSGSNLPFKFDVGDAALAPLAFPAGATGNGRAMNINTAGDIVGSEFTTFPARRRSSGTTASRRRCSRCRRARRPLRRPSSTTPG
jgi:uncharacterized membrane protein